MRTSDGHHREAAAVRAGAGGLDGGIQRQQVGLESDAIDHADDVGDAARAAVDGAHLFDHLRHDDAHLACERGGSLGRLARGHRRVGTVFHDHGDLLQRHGRLTQFATGALGAHRQRLAGRLQVGGGGGGGLRRLSNLRQSGCHALLHILQPLAGGGFRAQHPQVKPDAARRPIARTRNSTSNKAFSWCALRYAIHAT
jgi:hypothetical protein